MPRVSLLRLLLPLLAGLLWAGCRSPAHHRREADRRAYAILGEAEAEALGRNDGFRLERPADTLRRRLLLEQELPRADPASLGAGAVDLIPQWPDPAYFDIVPPVAVPTAAVVRVVTLAEALEIGAANSRDYQAQKEQVFQAALALDLEEETFRATWKGALETIFREDRSGEENLRGVENTDSLELGKRFKAGMQLTGMIAVDLVKLLSLDRSSAMGLSAEASLSIPLLRGSSRFVVAEPLTQAQRDVVYAIYLFERYKRTFAVRVASDYLAVLNALDQVANAEENYRRVGASTRRAQRLADAGRLPEIQVDQARQDELRARDRWVSAQQSHQRQLDELKVLLGLPPDAALELDRGELDRLAADDRYAPFLDPASRAGDGVPPGPLELVEGEALRMALGNRLDLRAAIGRIVDAQRGVAVAADNLRADVTLLGSGSIGEGRNLGTADSEDAQLRFDRGRYSAVLGLDLPFERAAERTVYRNRLIALEQAVRALQDAEDRVKIEVRNALRELLASRERVTIQAEAVEVARRRVDSTDLFLQAGRAQIRDVLEAEEALVSVQNALTAALVSYRVAELRLQRDLGLLEVNDQGLWREYLPLKAGDDDG